MADLLDVLKQIHDTEAALAKATEAAAQHPDRTSLQSAINSLRSRYEVLEKLFSSMTDEQHLDVFSYRLIPENGERYTLRTLANTLGDFQDILTLTYDAKKTGQRKERASWSADTARETDLSYGYSFSGSLGFVFTMSNERLLPQIDSVLDIAVKTIFEMAKADSSEQLNRFAKEIGIAPIRKLYKWASDHVAAGMNVDVRWKRKDEVRAALVIQQPELERLREVISKTSDEVEETIVAKGVLVGGDLPTKWFHFMPIDGKDMRGRLADSYKPHKRMELGKTYTATILKRTKKHYSTDEDDEQCLLVSLD